MGEKNSTNLVVIAGQVIGNVQQYSTYYRFTVRTQEVRKVKGELKEIVEYHKVTAFKNLDNVMKIIGEHDTVIVRGKITYSTWEKECSNCKTPNKRTDASILVETISKFIPGKKDRDEEQKPPEDAPITEEEFDI